MAERRRRKRRKKLYILNEYRRHRKLEAHFESEKRKTTVDEGMENKVEKKNAPMRVQLKSISTV